MVWFSVMNRHWSAALATCAWLVSALGCGGPAAQTLPDESGDYQPIVATPSHWLPGTVPIGRDVGGTEWTWVEAECTEGAPGLAEAGFSARARLVADDEGLLLVYDERVESLGCDRTVVQRAVPGQGADAGGCVGEELGVGRVLLVEECVAHWIIHPPGGRAGGTSQSDGKTTKIGARRTRVPATGLGGILPGTGAACRLVARGAIRYHPDHGAAHRRSEGG